MPHRAGTTGKTLRLFYVNVPRMQWAFTHELVGQFDSGDGRNVAPLNTHSHRKMRSRMAAGLYNTFTDYKHLPYVFHGIPHNYWA